MYSNSSQKLDDKLDVVHKYHYNASLPKIKSKRFFTSQGAQIGKHQSELYVERYKWVHEETNYEKITEEQLVKENKKLRKHLLEISESVDSLIMKNKPKSNFRIKTLANDDRAPIQKIKQSQINNNKVVLDMCNSQYKTLRLREKHITQFGKGFLDESIEGVREKIQVTKLKNRKLKDKNRILGNSIISVDDTFEQIHWLEGQKDVQRTRKLKLEKKLVLSDEKVSQMNEKMSKINGEYDIAEKYLKANKIVSETEHDQKQKAEKLQQKQHLYSLNKKKIQTYRLSKQQQYHNLLKVLETSVARLLQIETQISRKQIQILQSKAILEKEERKSQKQKKKSSNLELLLVTGEKEPFSIKSSISSIFEKGSQGEETKKQEKQYIDQNF